MNKNGFRIVCKGDYSKTKKYLKEMTKVIDLDYIKRVCDETIVNLQKASPNDNIAEGWSYEIVEDKKYISIFFNNSYVVDGQNIALLVNNGHATKGGTWISGKHFIEEPTQKAYEKILRHMWEEIQ